MGKSHDCVADKLQLRLELSVLRRQPLVPRALPAIVPVVGRGHAAGVATLKMVFPEL